MKFTYPIEEFSPFHTEKLKLICIFDAKIYAIARKYIFSMDLDFLRVPKKHMNSTYPIEEFFPFHTEKLKFICILCLRKVMP